MLQPDRTLTPWLDTSTVPIAGEEWRAVVGFEGLYEISSFGRVKALAGPKILRQSLNGPAVLVCLKKAGQPQRAVVKHLVARAWGLEKAAHTKWTTANAVREDNRLSNITALTQQQLVVRSLQLGRFPQTAALVASSRQRQQQRQEEVSLTVCGLVMGKVCTSCQAPQPLKRFRTDSCGKRTGRICMDCLTRRSGTLNPGNARLGRQLREKGLRRCTLCRVPRPLDAAHFPASKSAKLRGYGYVCHTCRPPKKGLVEAGINQPIPC